MAGRWRLTGLLVLVFAVLLAFVELNNRTPPAPIPPTFAPGVTPQPIQSGELFPNVQPGTISRVMITDEKSGKRLIWTRTASGWEATDGNGASQTVDLAAVARSIQILATLRYNRALEESDMAPYGLSGNGKAEIGFDVGTSESYRIRVGDNTPVDNLTYVQRNNDPTVYLVPSGPIALVTGALPIPSPTP